jgi:hypothetical protein
MRKRRNNTHFPPIKKSEFYNKILSGPEDDSASFDNEIR